MQACQSVFLILGENDCGTLIHVDPQKRSPDTCGSSRQNERVMPEQTNADGAFSSGGSHCDNKTS